MQKKILRMLMFFLLIILFVSCSVLEGIFKAGIGVGVFVVVAIVAIVIIIISKIAGRK